MNGELNGRLPRRRLSDLLDDADFLLVQVIVLQDSPHHSARKQQRIAELNRRLDIIEHRLRLRAAELGEDGQVTFGQLRRALRRKAHEYAGPERRLARVTNRLSSG